MANLKSSKKDAVVAKKNKLKNTSRRSMIKTFIKKVYLTIQGKDKISALNIFKKFQKIVDKHVAKKLIHKNKAARHKSSLYKQIKNLS